ncbi:MAG TPA: mismatch-specific DNA-glycosylase [Acidimicrobiales bacterium]|nr:mismatch-specific DNA-glycosylase [Acidimicrobiales bacterium]
MDRARVLPAVLDGRRVPAVRLPLELAALHRSLVPGERAEVRVGASQSHDRLTLLLAGGGFDVDAIAPSEDAVVALVTRARTLPDVVGPGMRLLVCGLNPSVYAADHGVGYARPGNRFWPAALDAGLVRRDRDPYDALEACGVGMTDLVKRATTGAAELSAGEYAAGARRVERLASWLRPGAVCFVGLAGWRSAVDRRAVPGPQPAPFGGRPAYVMPSTSGLNAHTSRAELAAHLAAAAALGA